MVCRTVAYTTNVVCPKFKFRSSSKALTVVEIKAVIFSPVVVNNNNNNGRVLKNYSNKKNIYFF